MKLKSCIVIISPKYVYDPDTHTHTHTHTHILSPYLYTCHMHFYIIDISAKVWDRHASFSILLHYTRENGIVYLSMVCVHLLVNHWLYAMFLFGPNGEPFVETVFFNNRRIKQRA
jgi:hypothetical protein